MAGTTAVSRYSGCGCGRAGACAVDVDAALLCRYCWYCTCDALIAPKSAPNYLDVTKALTRRPFRPCPRQLAILFLFLAPRTRPRPRLRKINPQRAVAFERDAQRRARLLLCGQTHWPLLLLVQVVLMRLLKMWCTQVDLRLVRLGLSEPRAGKCVHAGVYPILRLRIWVRLRGLASHRSGAGVD